ncbi:MAG: terminase small subunit [Alphaproteobacteria bacterium]
MAEPKHRWNDKLERFCVELILHARNPTEAALNCGYSRRSAKYMARDLPKRPDVAARLAELRAEAAKRAEITIDDMIRQFDQDRIDAKAAKQHSAAVNASIAKSKLLAMWVDQTANKNLNLNANAPEPEQTLSDTEFARRIAFALSRGVADMTNAPGETLESNAALGRFVVAEQITAGFEAAGHVFAEPHHRGSFVLLTNERLEKGEPILPPTVAPWTVESGPKVIEAQPEPEAETISAQDATEKVEVEVEPEFSQLHACTLSDLPPEVQRNLRGRRQVNSYQTRGVRYDRTG